VQALFDAGARCRSIDARCVRVRLEVVEAPRQGSDTRRERQPIVRQTGKHFPALAQVESKAQLLIQAFAHLRGERVGRRESC
jgi:hypothetical protein